MKATKRLQQNAHQFLRSFLDKNPELLKKYVSLGLTVVDSAIPPLNNVMKHLVVVQGLDPSVTVEQRRREALQVALTDSFNAIDKKDYDDNYDVSWAHSRFEKTQKSLSDLNLTQESFKKLTDLSNVDSPEHKVNVVSQGPSAFSQSQAAKWTDVAPTIILEEIPGGEDPEETEWWVKNRKNVNRAATTSPLKREIRLEHIDTVAPGSLVDMTGLPPEVKKIMKAKSEILKQRAANPEIFEEEKKGFLGETEDNMPDEHILAQLKQKATEKEIAHIFDPLSDLGDFLSKLEGLAKTLTADEKSEARKRGAQVAEDLKGKVARANDFFTPAKQQAVVTTDTQAYKNRDKNRTEIDLSLDEDTREVGIKATPATRVKSTKKVTKKENPLRPNSFRRTK